MKVNWLLAAVLAIAAGLGMALPASAQSPVFVTRNGAFVQDPNSPSDAAAAMAASEEGVEFTAPGEEEEPEEEKRWELTDLFTRADGSNPLADRGFYINGSQVHSYTQNVNSPADRFNGPMTWTDRSNEYQLNQLWTNFGRNVDLEDDDKFFDIGGKVSFIYGTNYRWYTSAGFEDEWGTNRAHSFYGAAFGNLYAELKTGKVTTKFGKFASPVGYMGIDSSTNLFNQLPYTFQYGEPFTHVGFISNWNQTEKLALGLGMVRGWDSWDGSGTASDKLGVVGTATYTFEDGGALNYFGIYSQEPNKLGANTPRYLQSLVYTRNLSDSVAYVFQTDFGTQSSAGVPDSAGALAPGNAYWYGLNQYLTWKQSDLVTWVGNLEWFRDDGGYRVGGVLPTDSAATSSVRGLPLDRYGYNGSFYRVMVGPRFTTGDNLFFRTAVAWDWYSGEAKNVGGLRPYDDGTKNQQLVVSGDMVLLY